MQKNTNITIKYPSNNDITPKLMTFYISYSFIFVIFKDFINNILFKIN